MMRNLKKQKQLLEMELEPYVARKKRGLKSIHLDSYYVKLAHAHKRIDESIKILSTIEEDVFENFRYTEQ